MNYKKEAVHSSSVFVNIESCTLSFKDGKKMSIYSDANKSLIINVTVDEPNITAFKESVMKHFRSSDTLPELAEKCGYACTKTFNRHFVKQFNETPKQWMLNIKEEEMIHLLEHTNTSYEIISSLLKFKNISHFNNFCKKRTGLTPSEIRTAKNN